MLRTLTHISNGTVQCVSSTKTFPVPLLSLVRTLNINSVLKKDKTPTSESTPAQGSSVSPGNETEELDKLYKTIELEMRAYEPAVLKSYSWFATTAAKELGIKVGECWAVRKPDHDRFSLLKSIHIYKKHQVQYEVRTYFRFARFHCLTTSTADTFLEYIERNLPEGVGMKVTKVAIEKLPDHMKAPTPLQLEQ